MVTWVLSVTLLTLHRSGDSPRAAPRIIGIVAKPGSSVAEESVHRVLRLLGTLGVEALVEEETAKHYESLQRYPKFRLDMDPPDRIIVVGGDGTLLRTFMLLSRPDSVVMGIRAGKRGFLLDVEQYEIEDRVRDFVAGEYRVEEYFRAEVFRGEKRLGCVLNDAVIMTKMSKMVKLSVYIDGERAMGIDGDGVIVSTTVGSSAYSLSAGGPVVDPRVDVFVVTPMNPVQLFLRPIIAPPDSIIEVEVTPGSNELYLSLDGQIMVDLGVGDIVTVKRCEEPVRIARFKWWENYYERLYTRLLTYW